MTRCASAWSKTSLHPTFIRSPVKMKGSLAVARRGPTKQIKAVEAGKEPVGVTPRYFAA